MTEDELQDIIYSAMDDTVDMDVTLSMLARAAAKAVARHLAAADAVPPEPEGEPDEDSGGIRSGHPTFSKGARPKPEPGDIVYELHDMPEFHAAIAKMRPREGEPMARLDTLQFASEMIRLVGLARPEPEGESVEWRDKDLWDFERVAFLEGRQACSDVLDAGKRWMEARRRQREHYDFKGEVQMELQGAERDLEEALLLANEKPARPEPEGESERLTLAERLVLIRAVQNYRDRHDLVPELQGRIKVIIGKLREDAASLSSARAKGGGDV